MFSVITDIPDEAGVYCQWRQFEKMDSLSRMVYSADAVDFAPDKVELIDGEGSRGGLMLANGKYYQTPAAMKMYEPARNKDNLVEIIIYRLPQRLRMFPWCMTGKDIALVVCGI